MVVPEINAGTASLVATAINPAIGLGTFLAQMFLRRAADRAPPRRSSTSTAPGPTRKITKVPPRGRAAATARDARPPPATHARRRPAHESRRHPDGVRPSPREANLARARALLARGRRGRRRLAVLPEYFCLMGAARHRQAGAARAVRRRRRCRRFLADAARELGLWIVGGTLPLAAGDDAHVRNTIAGLFAARASASRATTRSTCSASTTARERYDERRVIEPRRRRRCCSSCPRATATRWRVGLCVCYDLRFPELYRALAGRAPTCCWCPAPSPTPPAQAHWELLLRARAIENLAYVVAPAQGGLHENGRRTWGHSMVVDPWGAVLAQRAERRGRGAGRARRGAAGAVRARSCRRWTHRVL